MQANLDLLGSERDARTPQIAAEIRALKARAVADFIMSWAKALLGRALTEVKLTLESPAKLATGRVEILKVVGAYSDGVSSDAPAA